MRLWTINNSLWTAICYELNGTLLHLTTLLHLSDILNFLLITFVKNVKNTFAGLKTRKYHIICSWILLICFVAGQCMVYSHQHNIIKPGKTYHISKNLSKETVKEKCALCDIMHHNTMVTANDVFFSQILVVDHVFKSFEYNFKSISLILSIGRAPPVSNSSR